MQCSVMEEIVIKKDDFERILNAVSKIKEDIDAIQEELEILANRNFVDKIKEGLEDLKEGRIYGIEEFKKVIRE